MRLVQQDGDGVGHHEGLEHHLVELAVLVEHAALGGREVHAPVGQEDIELGEVLVLGAEDGRGLDEFPEVAGALDAVGKG